ncbi:hypothetical protein [Synechococcus sp. CCY 0621]|uniref:hypothetical protein n=1 Tax=Synechococcus sp. CCY 0621 TaxID=2815603 RepID=UPI001C219A9A|nr:hypothetical protein [Synechococcus sp. CCY 0621]
MSPEAFQRYKEVVGQISVDFQWIEELLKIVISSGYEAIRRTAPAKIKFKRTRSNLEKDSLGKLITKYEELYVNDVLIKELRSLASERNYCAHQSFILTLEEQTSEELLARMSIRFEAVRARSRACVKTLMTETRDFATLLEEPIEAVTNRHSPESSGETL